ncbi:NAD-dependent epimerase/dehydratase family protein [Actinomadura gamaensis]|uniref:NAD-dependent epimerase/dehydratase family protein n=1 Tax=Actinomadura gamaensis TaxID=1763541 RepID=A0ABV9U131_9ACTN
MSAHAVAVLGGAGFVGRHVSAAFAAEGWDVLVVGRARPPAERGASFAALDLAGCRPAEIAGVLAAHRPEVVVNAVGANWNVTRYQMRRANTDATRNTLAALALLPARPRLVHLGSVLEFGPLPEGTVLREDRAARPAGPAGRTKLAATRAVRRAFRSGVVTGAVLRLPNVVGPGAPAASLAGAVAAELAAARARGLPAVLELGPLADRRDYLDVRDVAGAVLAAARVPAAAIADGPALNLGSGRAVPVGALVDLLVEISGVPATVAAAGRRQPADARAGRAQPRDAASWIRVDASRARAVLGWRPRRSLRDSLHDLWLEFGEGDEHARAIQHRELDG